MNVVGNGAFCCISWGRQLDLCFASIYTPVLSHFVFLLCAGELWTAQIYHLIQRNGRMLDTIPTVDQWALDLRSLTWIDQAR
jgi:hypothetical protein